MSDAQRWNHKPNAIDYDQAAPSIHPHYLRVQREVLEALPPRGERTLHVIDLGGGSGRLIERLLEQRTDATATLVEPSGAFRDLARRRLERFIDRVALVDARAEHDWPQLCHTADAIVSTSALHHLDGDHKTIAFRQCLGALRKGGVLINGDEYRSASDQEYRSHLQAWSEHMQRSLDSGDIPSSFAAAIEAWRRRNLYGFGEPRQNGDDCHETTEEQTERLIAVGFQSVETRWRNELWAVLRAAA